eukprot:TRINITY_DN1150_c0_g4_i1.p1 TRINITY_DN1150_c0_g4~~TRINITY_DN1150_c0_g4_i1.p1  ORF type:complete len:130 (+),score=21.17 TRINITY_DN1150_c0_g4_i1:158-547(+)
MEVVGKTKGLDNEFGENNCFLNVVIQALWHLKSFRTKYFGKNVQHKHIDSVSCVYCALQTLFSNYEYGDESHLPPKVLRDALDAIYKSEEKFQLGQLVRSKRDACSTPTFPFLISTHFFPPFIHITTTG